MSGRMFDSIDGHTAAKQTLSRALRDGKTAHAYLFSGPDGVGKKLTAIEFAKKLNCERGGGDDLCDCPACDRIGRGVHPDVSVFEYPGSSVITVDNTRGEIERRVFLKPFESKHKIFIVDGAERMNSSAQNAFLKTLEEPPAYSVIILITHLPSLILPTIRSRCQTVSFGGLDGRVAREKLLEKGELSEREAALAVAVAGGSPGKALGITPGEAGAMLETIGALARLGPEDPAGVFSLVEKIVGKEKTTAGQRAEAEKFADWASLWIRDLLRASAGAGEAAYGELEGASKDFADGRSAASIASKAFALEEAVAGVRRGNLNCRLALETFVFKVVEV